MNSYRMTNKETLSYIRKEAKKLGLTLKEQYMTINYCKSYRFIERGNKYNVIVSNMTLSMALNRIELGELINWKEW